MKIDPDIARRRLGEMEENIARLRVIEEYLDERHEAARSDLRRAENRLADIRAALEQEGVLLPEEH